MAWIAAALRFLGCDAAVLRANLRALPRYRREYRELRRQLHGRTDFPFGKRYPMLHDRTDESGMASGAYFHQDLLVARRIHQRNPAKHVDVGSRVDGFVAHVASFRRIEVLDVRPANASVPNVVFTQCDLMEEHPELDEYTDSLSCLHAIEHFGLGRYGDRIDADGHLRGLRNLTRMLQPGGILYLSAPIGPQRIEFNAHRVFGVGYLVALLSENFDVAAFSYVDDAGSLQEDTALTAMDIGRNFGCTYGCGIFELVKR